ncbi:DUF732 domain-containing protein [Rhodococcus sp. IEGM 1408]|uniref:DUF732 domain-containing protein n=1 Tax=Rhodococcus sp. IEGM 1408 TaxID=3082220 RepID=UPI002954C428|nr:DUF732 domain-containing protein [Rhodococcus sp. IEGM 1408]MDV8001735.1 DUF732 domain-containing protein [Rhodococcus sp. IEGM 1408]
MTIRPRLAAASAIVALGLAASTAGCGAVGPEVEATGASVPASGQEASPTEGAVSGAETTAGGMTGPARTAPEQEYLDQLAAFGVPTDMTSETTVEVGLGICRGIADGADTETILDRIRPLSSAIAAQDTRRDTAEVGRAIIDASRTHLCG